MYFNNGSYQVLPIFQRANRLDDLIAAWKRTIPTLSTSTRSDSYCRSPSLTPSTTT